MLGRNLGKRILRDLSRGCFVVDSLPNSPIKHISPIGARRNVSFWKMILRVLGIRGSRFMYPDLALTLHYTALSLSGLPHTYVRRQRSFEMLRNGFERLT